MQQGFGQTGLVQMLVGLLFVDESGHHAGQDGRVVGRKERLAQAFGHQQGLIDAQLGGPQSILGESLGRVHKPGGLQKLQMALKVIP